MVTKMSVRDESRHLCYESINDIALSCDSYFQDIDLNFFGHIRVYRNGEYFFLCSGQEWPRWGFAQIRNPPIGYLKFSELKSGVYFPGMNGEDSPLAWSSDIILQSRDQFHIKNPMLIIKHYGEFYDAFFFDIHSDHPYETYLRELPNLYHFIDWHKDLKHKLIQRVNSNLLKVDAQYCLPQPVVTPEDSENRPQPQYYELMHNGQFTRITNKEFDCLQSLSKGATSKVIANRQGLSYRTVEHRITEIKEKLQCHTKQQLIDLFWVNFSDRIAG